MTLLTLLTIVNQNLWILYIALTIQIALEF